jgi:L-fucose mutarotase/ribose pyranase (RbsD/FucU family)
VGSQTCQHRQLLFVRFKFYEEARGCYAIVQVLERRPYGNVVLTKGVVGPDGKDLMP